MNRKLCGIHTYPEPISFWKIRKMLRKENNDSILLENTIQPYIQYTKEFGDKVYLHLHNDFLNLPRLFHLHHLWV